MEVQQKRHQFHIREISFDDKMKIQAFLILFIFTNLAISAPTAQDESEENGRIPDIPDFFIPDFQPQNANGNGGKCCLAQTTSPFGPCCREHIATCGSWEEARQVLFSECV